MELNGGVALVTGAAHRVGKTIALALARAGANIAIHYHHSSAQAEATLAELRALGGEAIAIAGNLAILAEAEQAVDTAIAGWGRLDLLVNCAGIWGRTPIGTVSEERWDELLNINLRSAFFMAQRATPALRRARGAIVNIADAGALRPWRNHTPYTWSARAAC